MSAVMPDPPKSLRRLLRGPVERWDKVDAPAFSAAWRWAYRALLLGSRYEAAGAQRNFAGMLTSFHGPHDPNTPLPTPGLPAETWPDEFILALLSPPPAPLSTKGLREIYGEVLTALPEDLWPLAGPSVDAEGRRLDTDEALLDRLRNGIHPCEFTPVVGRPGLVETCLSLRADEHDADGDWLHTRIRVRCHVAGGRWTLGRITIDRGEPGTRGYRRLASDPEDERFPHAAHQLRRAKTRHVVRCALLLLGQTDHHLGRAHVAVEVAAWLLGHRQTGDKGAPDAARDDLPPALDFLRAQLRDVAGINHFGEPLIFGPPGALPRNADMAADQLELRMGRAALSLLALLPVPAPAHDTEGDRYRAASYAAWLACRDYVRGQLGGAAWQAGLGIWRRLFVSMWAALRSPARWRLLAAVPPELWRPAGLWRVARAWLRSPASLAERVATTVVHAATFRHTWVNDAQAIDGGDPWFATLGLRRTALGDVGATTLQAWRDAAMPPVRDVSFQLFLAYTLTRVDLGFVARSPDEPRHAAELHEQRVTGDEARLAALAAAFRAKQDALGGATAAERMEACGLSLERLRARVNT